MFLTSGFAPMITWTTPDFQPRVKLTFGNSARRVSHFRDRACETANEGEPHAHKHDRQCQRQREPRLGVKEKLITDKGIGHHHQVSRREAGGIRGAPADRHANPVPRRTAGGGAEYPSPGSGPGTAVSESLPDLIHDFFRQRGGRSRQAIAIPIDQVEIDVVLF